MACEHTWDRTHEQCVIGGTMPTGWMCSKCRMRVSQDSLTPAGLSGTVSGIEILEGPGTTSKGAPFNRQIQYPDGRLVIE